MGGKSQVLCMLYIAACFSALFASSQQSKILLATIWLHYSKWKCASGWAKEMFPILHFAVILPDATCIVDWNRSYMIAIFLCQHKFYQSVIKWENIIII